MDISVVIPTRNRQESLLRLLGSLNQQAYPFREIIIVDSSDEPIDICTLKQHFPTLTICLLRSDPSVCVQRNIGIRKATSSHIFLCDDDLEFPQHYVSHLTEFLKMYPEVGVVTGRLVEPDMKQNTEDSFRIISFVQLLWNFIFQLTVWADLDKTHTQMLSRLPFRLLRKYYKSKHNTFSLAGWPLVTEVQVPYFRTAIYSLGGAIIRRQWLLDSPYDEILDPHGIGDNYGVALDFPEDLPIAVLMDTYVMHSKSNINRLAPQITYFRRLLALDYFMTKSKKFSLVNRGFLIWSLIGNLLAQSAGFNTRKAWATIKAAYLIATGRNPYSRALKQRLTQTIRPEL